MADTVVSFLLHNLPRLLKDEFMLLSGIEDKIISLTKELKFIDLFLKSSKGNRNNDFVKLLVSQIRDVAHQVEDVIDTYIANVKHTKNPLNFVQDMKELHNINAQIEKIKNNIDEIYKNKERYGIGEGKFKREEEEEQIAELLRIRRRDVEEEHVVGFVHDSSVIIEQLMETDLRLKVVSIIGMGGLGKTTLARKIYNNTQVKEMFPCRSWGDVSNDYKSMELFQVFPIVHI